jgi:O-antigen/teichoic acid export membrane protein
MTAVTLSTNTGAPINAMGVRSRIVFLLARLVPNLLGVVTAAVLTRLLKPGEYGLYALALSIISFLTIGVFEWLALSLLRMAPTAEQPSLFFGTVLTCFWTLCGLSISVTALVLVLAGLQNYAFLSTACLVATFAAAWFELKQRLQLAELRETDYFWASTGRGALTITFVCAASYFYGTASVIILVLATSFFAASFIRREPRLNFRNVQFDISASLPLLRFGLPLSISIGLGSMLGSVDKWLLQGLSGPQAVGLFSAAAIVAQTPLMALAGGIGPLAYSMAVQALEFRSLEEARAQLAQNFTILLGIAAPSAAGIIALSDNLAHLMVGAAYWQSVIHLTPWLSAAAMLATVRMYYVDIAFQLAHRTSRLIWTNLITAVANIALDIWLIPKLAELGAAISSFSVSCISLTVAAIASIGVFRLPIPLVDTAKVMLSTGIMFLLLQEFAGFSGILALAFQVGAGFLIYVSGLVAFNVLGVRGRLIQHLSR